MAIGAPLPFRAGWSHGILLGIFLVGLSFVSRADDEIIKKDGTQVTGQITGVSGGQVALTQAAGKTIIYLSDIKSVNMATPAAVTAAQGAAPAQVISALSPVIQQYAGLPADWVLAAMGQVADAYDASGDSAKAGQVYAQINQLYPNSPYQKLATVGQAKIDVKSGKVDAALAAINPLIAQANLDIAPSPADGRLFAGAFLVYGQALEAQKQYPQALEAYLTVKTMFYQNPALVTEADAAAKTLLAQHPGTGVD